VPLDTALHAEQIGKLLADSGSSVLFCGSKYLGTAGAAAVGLVMKIVLTDGDAGEGPVRLRSGQVRATPAELRSAGTGETPVPTRAVATRAVADLDGILAAGPGGFSARESASEGLASLLYTSGTTADPKGVMLTHSNIMGEVAAVFAWVHIGPEDALLGVLPLFHVLSQMANLLLPLVKGSRIVYLETLNTTELIRALRERGITAFAVVPQFFYLIHERIFKEAAKRGRVGLWALGRLMAVNRLLRKVGINAGPVFFGKIHQTFGTKMRYLFTGGSRFDPQIGHDFHDLGIDVLQAYGLTETTGGAFATRHENNVIGSVGPALHGVEGKIVNAQPQDGGPAIGEIAIRGPIVMKGYWNRPDATAAVLKDGWFYSGDLGYFDANGNLFLTGRSKEVIVLSNGKNIYPEEIEPHYLKSPYIKEICVMGLEDVPGDATSEHLHAVVVPNFEVLKERKIVNAKEVIRFDIEGLSAQLPSTKRIGSYEIWQEDLPRTTTRKLKRFEIEKLVRANQAKGKTSDADVPSEKPLSEEDAAWLDQPEIQRALTIIRESVATRPEAIRPDDNLELDLGLDSLQRVELLSALEQELGGSVEESSLSEIYTVRALVDAVRESAAVGGAGSRPQFAGWNSILKEASTEPAVLALAKTRPISEIVLFAISRVIQIFALDRFHLKVTGLEKLPARGAFILCSNHQSYFDPMILASLLPGPVFRKTFAVGTSDIFGSGFMRRLAPWVRVVVVDPDANLISAMRAGASGLRQGRVLILYPEGERSIDGTPRIFKKGAAILSIQLQVPIVPVAIEGFHDAWPRGKAFQKFVPLKVVVGDPIYPPAEGEASEEAYAQLTAELKRRIVGMWEGLRGAS
jgi:long-chain acyl-CoA synthetase